MLCENRVVIVTGAGRGIGRAHALAFAKAGAKVVVNDIGATLAGGKTSDSPAQKVVNKIKAMGGEAVANFDDVANKDSSKNIIQCALDNYGNLDVLVNNAGILRDRMLVSCSEDEWDSVIRVHLKGHFCTMHHAGQYWRKRCKEGQNNQGRIINTSSGAGLQGSIGQLAYSAAKGGIASMTLVAAAELGRYGVTVNAIAPAARTRMTEDAFAEMMKKPETGFDKMDPANISPMVVWLGSAESEDVTGRVFEIAGGELSLADGWRKGPTIERDEQWPTDQIGPAVRELMERAVPPQKVYGT